MKLISLPKELATLLTRRHLDLEVFPLYFSKYILFHGTNTDDTLAYTGRIKSLASEYISELTVPAVSLTPDPDLKGRMVQQTYRDVINHDLACRCALNPQSSSSRDRAT